MDVQKKLDEIVTMVSGARAMPMSASCVVNRAELLSLLEELRTELPGSLAQAQELIGDRDQMVAQARQEAERIIEGAHAERGSLVAGTEVARRSQAEADRILAEARQEAEEVRAEADDYVDSKLANFEVVLTKTLGSVGRGREKLLGTGPGLDENGYEDEDAPERSHDPETLRRDADSYVDTKLGAFEAVLAKTLEAVGRGRQKLHGRIATDDLGALADDTTTVRHSSDADYLADLAALSDAPAAPLRAPEYGEQQLTAAAEYGERQLTAAAEYGEQQPAAAQATPETAQPAYGYAQQPDPYAGYAQQGYDGGQDAYGYQQQPDPYAGYAQQGYDGGQAGYDTGRQPAYDTGQQGGYPALPPAAPQPPQAQPQILDETSLFDTSMISAEQLRAYEQGRGL
ncbi:ATP synthase F0 subunit B [Streptomyces tagetis]|uniref:Cell division initiation protein n=1 Tax=Streptomyces tagetis TaxID=2820809 RepID=A0A941B116_9ACTN|nr:ATP synthase F0 subunit B [Streptomyces sp. RG38]MBQ0827965.1 cell division initiation protein [Streptomyces sp. RG38]